MSAPIGLTSLMLWLRHNHLFTTQAAFQQATTSELSNTSSLDCGNTIIGLWFQLHTGAVVLTRPGGCDAVAGKI